MPKAALELGHVTVRLGGRNVVDGVSFSVEHGDWVTLIGPNGAGKTSLMRAIAGLVGHRGEIRLDGDPLRALRRKDVAQRVALVPQTPLLPAGMSVEEYVLLGRTPYVSYMGREGRRGPRRRRVGRRPAGPGRAREPAAGHALRR